MEDLFATTTTDRTRQQIADGAVLLRGFAGDGAAALLAGIDRIAAAAPFRHMVTPGGFRMSVAMTNSGPLGWTTDRRGYLYAPLDPETGLAWPPLPAAFRKLAVSAAAAGGYPAFEPDSCLINRYTAGTKLSLHQDRDEHDLGHPIVSVSLGLPAKFLFGGPERTDPAQRLRLEHGDVVVWGGPSRLFFHGIAPLAAGDDPRTGAVRFNLTFRRAGDGATL